MSPDADAVVVGAGPAGTSTALFLAGEGFRVVLMDRSCFPRPKACGEGVMPGGIPILAELDLLDLVEREGRRFHGVRFLSRSGAIAEGRFPNGKFGIVIPRERLDQLLLEKAKASPRITVLEGYRALRIGFSDAFRVITAQAADGERSQEICARWVAAGDGALSTSAKMLGVTRRSPRRRRFGLRARFDGVAGLGECVEVFLMPGYEIYVAPHPGRAGKALVALLMDGDRMSAFEGRTREAFHEAIFECDLLRKRMLQAEQRTPILGAGPLGGSADRWQGRGWLLVGDAASSLDPITGEGVAVALLNGRLAARHIASALRGENEKNPAGAYSWERRKLLFKKRILERFMLETSRIERVSNAMLAQLGRHPGLFAALLSDC